MTRHIILHPGGWGGDGETSGLISNLVSTHHHYQKVLQLDVKKFCHQFNICYCVTVLLIHIYLLVIWSLDITEQYPVISVISDLHCSARHCTELCIILSLVFKTRPAWIKIYKSLSRSSDTAAFYIKTRKKLMTYKLSFKRWGRTWGWVLFFGTINILNSDEILPVRVINSEIHISNIKFRYLIVMLMFQFPTHMFDIHFTTASNKKYLFL